MKWMPRVGALLALMAGCAAPAGAPSSEAGEANALYDLDVVDGRSVLLRRAQLPGLEAVASMPMPTPELPDEPTQGAPEATTHATPAHEEVQFLPEAVLVPDLRVGLSDAPEPVPTLGVSWDALSTEVGSMASFSQGTTAAEELAWESDYVSDAVHSPAMTIQAAPDQERFLPECGVPHAKSAVIGQAYLMMLPGGVRWSELTGSLEVGFALDPVKVGERFQLELRELKGSLTCGSGMPGSPVKIASSVEPEMDEVGLLRGSVTFDLDGLQGSHLLLVASYARGSEPLGAVAYEIDWDLRLAAAQ